jgi:hypothetical protein
LLATREAPERYEGQSKDSCDCRSLHPGRVYGLPAAPSSAAAVAEGANDQKHYENDDEKGKQVHADLLFSTVVVLLFSLSKK